MTGPAGAAGRQGAGRVDLFVSYAGPDRPWAEWAAAVLEDAGYAVVLDVWDWAPGDNFVLRMNDALSRTDRVLALWSDSYFQTGRYTTSEWISAFVDGIDDAQARATIPVRVTAVTPPKVLAGVIYQDVFGVDDDVARRRLLDAVRGPSGRGRPVAFPGTHSVVPPAPRQGPRRPGLLPAVWNAPPRMIQFTGRTTLLADLRTRLAGGQATLVAAVNGLGGVGKTSLAVEYAHLFAGEYERVWWVDAEHPELIGDNLSQLAVASGWADRDASVTILAETVAARLRHSDRWLVVFDNVEDPEHVRAWIPQGPGHVIITSRHRGFTGLAVPVEVQVFARTESMELIHAHLPVITSEDADGLAQELGDLPLALTQAIGLLAETAMTVGEYLTELTEHARVLLLEGRGGSYPVSLAAAIETTLSRLRGQDAAGMDLLHLTALLAPDPIPLDWLRQAPPGLLPASLDAIAAKPLALRRTLGRLADLGIIQIGDHTLQVHRLTQAVLRDIRTSSQLMADRDAAARLVAAAQPDDNGSDPRSWPAWAALLPHLLTLDPTTAATSIRDTACNALWYLLMRGDYHPALPLADGWHSAWRHISGGDDPAVLAAANQCAAVRRFLGRDQEAYDLDRVTHEVRRRVLGPDHRDTLASAHNLAIDLRRLGRYREAHDLGQEAHDARRRVLGRDHPDTLASAHSLAADLRRLGRYQEAYDLDHATYEARQRVLGPDHLNTLRSASSLANDLRRLDRYQEAYEVDHATQGTRRRVLGPDHPDTLASAHGLAADLRGLGRYREAYEVDQVTQDARRRVLGLDHPETLDSAHGLAADLRGLDRYQEAHDLDQVTYEARRRILGVGKPDTLRSATSLAADLRGLGQYQDAYELDQDADIGYRRLLGADHPETLDAAHGLADDLRGLGRHHEAYDLDRAAHDIRRRVLGPDHPATLASAHRLATLEKLGRPAGQPRRDST